MNRFQVGMIVAILRNFNANTKVIGAVVRLLSIPFVLPISDEDISEIKEVFFHFILPLPFTKSNQTIYEFHTVQVYIQTKLLPNLMVASKIICTVREGNSTVSSSTSSSNLVALNSNQEEVVFR